ncbi:MAG: Zn-ribbon domain-containing OB-fold protein [Acidimicrobiia bacterium]
MTTPERPLAMSTGPYRLDDDTWLDPPTSIDGRARPGAPQESAAFWAALDRDVLLLPQCDACGRFTYFPGGGCQWCGGTVHDAPVDGRGVVNTWTLSLLEFGPGMEVPYVTALVNPLCEPGLQIMTNLVRCRVSDIRIGMAVRPWIVHGSSRSLLLYEPDSDA